MSSWIVTITNEKIPLPIRIENIQTVYITDKRVKKNILKRFEIKIIKIKSINRMFKKCV